MHTTTPNAVIDADFDLDLRITTDSGPAVDEACTTNDGCAPTCASSCASAV